jgi:hypothetical protein
VLDVVQIEDEDSPFAGQLEVGAAWNSSQDAKAPRQPCQRGNEHAQQVPVEMFTLICGCPQCEQVGRCFVIPIGRALRLLSA